MPASKTARQRAREDITAEILSAARTRLTAAGPGELSLRAVARDVGMVSSAVYRYFPSRDDLLTALIIDAYDALGQAVEAADAVAERGEVRARWVAAAQAARAWALANPAEYSLIYGSPVPGYAAPGDTVGPALRPALVLMGILADAVRSGAMAADHGERLPPTLRAEFAAIADRAFPGLPAGTLSRGMTAWVHLFGMLSFEVFGHFINTIHDLDAYFTHQMDAMAGLVGLP
jgi:AcrR family transcriptional regulator